MRANIDIQPCGEIDITGQMQVLPTANEIASLDDDVYGQTGLAEQDTVNNFAQARAVQGLFFNGFDVQ